MYDAFLARIAHLADALELLKTRTAGDDIRAPHAAARSESEGQHALCAWRLYHGLSARTLPHDTGFAPAYAREIETGRKPSSLAAYKSVITALDVPLELLVTDEE